MSHIYSLVSCTKDYPAEVLRHHHFFHHLQSLAPEAHAVHPTQWLPLGDLSGWIGVNSRETSVDWQLKYRIVQVGIFEFIYIQNISPPCWRLEQDSGTIVPLILWAAQGCALPVFVSWPWLLVFSIKHSSRCQQSNVQSIIINSSVTWHYFKCKPNWRGDVSL